MSEWFDVLAVDELPPGEGTTVTLPDGQEVAVFNVDGTIHACDNACLHQGGPLGEGFLEGDVVTCPWHGWEYRVSDGECLEVPGQTLDVYPTRVEGGRILVQGR